MKIIDKLSFEIKKVYKQETGNDEFVHYFMFPFAYNEVADICNNKQCKQIKQLDFPFIIPYTAASNTDWKRMPTKDKLFKQFDRTGLFKIELVDGSILLYARWMEGAGRTRDIVSLVVAEKENLYKFFKMIRVAKKNRARPKTGLYTVSYHQMLGLMYEKLEKLPNVPVIHPMVEEIEKEIEFYFGNLPMFRRFNQNGNRKIMLMSEPGTGKSSLFYKLSRKYQEKMSVVFGMNLSAIAAHMTACSKYKVPTLIFIEDADSVLRGDSSAVLNFLDGVLNPPNPAGTFIAMSTNFPDKIEPRILQRPGRIDRIYKFGTLSGDYALQCGRLYFGEYIDKSVSDEQLSKLVSGMTGAQIKEIAQSCFGFAASSQRNIDVELIKEVRNKIKEGLEEAYRLAEANSLLNSKRKTIGFGFDSEPENDWSN